MTTTSLPEQKATGQIVQSPRRCCGVNPIQIDESSSRSFASMPAGSSEKCCVPTHHPLAVKKNWPLETTVNPRSSQQR